MRVMVTGGAGYIGSVVCEELRRGGHDVTVFDNLSKGHRGALVEGSTFVEGSLLDRDALRKAFEGERIDAVVHMAADSLVGESVSNPARYYRSNVEGSLLLLEAMLAADVKRFVLSSTAAVYGEPEKQPIEEQDATQPTNPYGETKLAVEHALRWYSSAYALRYTSLRYFNAAGATERLGEDHSPETHLIPRVLSVAAGDEAEVVVFGDDYPTRDGTCVRDYIHVVDLARAHVLALGSDTSNIFNLGCGGDGYSVREVIDTARKVTGREIRERVAARRPGDPATLVASSTRIGRELGWAPSRTLTDIIDSAWRWRQAHPRGYGG